MNLNLSSKATGALIKLNDLSYEANKVPLSAMQRLKDEMPEDHALLPVIEAFMLYRAALAEFDSKRKEAQP